MDKKYRVEAGSVQETLLIPLIAKKTCSERFPDFFSDESALRVIESIDYDWSRMADNFLTRFGTVEAGMRVLDLQWEIEDYIKSHPRAAVVNLGCGLDDMFARVDNGQIKGYNLDLPDVIKIRNELLPPGERERNIPCDLNDTGWTEKIDSSDGAVFFASGVFYYFRQEQMAELLKAMAQAFPGCRLCFDVGNKKALKLMLRAYIKGSDMKVDAFFSIEDPEELQIMLPKCSVSARGYMTGYKKLDKSMPWLYRFLAKFGDKSYGLKIIRIDF